MSERSRSSGVQGLRAMFEQSNETTSPPSRGRSPAGSITSDGSRPYSKVRTSFISVDRGDQPGSASQKMSSSEANTEGQNDIQPNGTPKPPNAEVQPVNDSPLAGQKGHNGEIGEAKGTREIIDVAAANPDKPVTGAEEDPANILPADPKEESAITGGTALKENGPDLGSVLKGSPFGTEDDKVQIGPQSKGETTSVEDQTPSEAPKSIDSTNGQEPLTEPDSILKSNPILDIKASSPPTAGKASDQVDSVSKATPTALDGSSDGKAKKAIHSKGEHCRVNRIVSGRKSLRSQRPNPQSQRRPQQQLRSPVKVRSRPTL